MPQLSPSFHLLRRIGWRTVPPHSPVAEPARATIADAPSAGTWRDDARRDDGPMPDAEGWLPIRWFAPSLDACGCSGDYWIRSGATQLLAFYCDREFDGKPAGWFDRYGEPAGMVPDSFRPAED
ncbi:hypothetical protein MKI84_14985 [Ancylobacter sp. A5.8]|uniref:hypothetical protein n=1 Tax=Ancylobacter gelatini TaxID=2919920 RepID=UPI001F4E0674|nr:hypothetical protein [Ancylobacter gelatini]MCJ8144225.1 hypothetical protein [Ancylobacter gelatini]